MMSGHCRTATAQMLLGSGAVIATFDGLFDVIDLCHNAFGVSQVQLQTVFVFHCMSLFRPRHSYAASGLP